MRIGTLTLAAALLAVSACGGGGSGNSSNPYGNSDPTSPGTPSTPVDQNPAPTTPNTINANPLPAFNPTTLTVAAGSTVTFHFGSVAHQISFTSPGSPANLPQAQNTSINVDFPTAGSYNFYCTIHTYMTGTITVQ